MLYLEEKKDWIMVAWRGKRNFLKQFFFFLTAL